MPYSQKNSKGTEYWLHTKVTSRGAKLFFFSKDSADAIDLPAEFEVMEGPTGMLMVKRKK